MLTLQTLSIHFVFERNLKSTCTVKLLCCLVSFLFEWYLNQVKKSYNFFTSLVVHNSAGAQEKKKG